MAYDFIGNARKMLKKGVKGVKKINRGIGNVVNSQPARVAMSAVAPGMAEIVGAVRGVRANKGRGLASNIGAAARGAFTGGVMDNPYIRLGRMATGRRKSFF